jgi:hypothetical protein
MLVKAQVDKNGPAIACDLTAIAPDQRERHTVIAEQLFGAVQETQELPDGYAFRLPQESDMLLKAAEFMSNERLCCSFFGFTLEIEPQGGPFWLKLTGNEQVQQFIQAEFSLEGVSLSKDNTFQVATQPPVIACDPGALTAEEHKHWLEEIGPQLYGAIQEIQELPNGYAFRLPSDPESLRLVAEDLNMERLCCPFVRYTLEVEPNRGAFWLRFTGGEGVKEFLRMAFESGNLLDERVAKAAGFSIAARTDLNSVETTLETIDRVNERFARGEGSLIEAVTNASDGGDTFGS